MASPKKTKPRKLPDRLTPRQALFCQEYLVDLNATQAAIRAGYSPKSSQQQSAALLLNPMVSAEIAVGRARISDRLEVTQERVVREFARLAFLDIRKAFNPDGTLKPVRDLDDDTAAAIAGLEVESLYEGKGADREEVGRLHKVKLADKKGALDSLAKHLGMFIERTELTGKDGKPLEIITRQRITVVEVEHSPPRMIEDEAESLEQESP